MPDDISRELSHEAAELRRAEKVHTIPNPPPLKSLDAQNLDAAKQPPPSPPQRRS
jgi:hypothetical protein